MHSKDTGAETVGKLQTIITCHPFRHDSKGLTVLNERVNGGETSFSGGLLAQDVVFRQPLDTDDVCPSSSASYG